VRKRQQLAFADSKKDQPFEQARRALGETLSRTDWPSDEVSGAVDVAQLADLQHFGFGGAGRTRSPEMAAGVLTLSYGNILSSAGMLLARNVSDTVGATLALSAVPRVTPLMTVPSHGSVGDTLLSSAPVPRVTRVNSNPSDLNSAVVLWLPGTADSCTCGAGGMRRWRCSCAQSFSER
jgi:hypothetical protein